ncbi:Inositol-polyphosphate multikinase [Bertholletia excelsa]
MLKAPSHQVAGHQAADGMLGPLIDDSGRFYKPLPGDERASNEVGFYTSFSSNVKIPSHIHKFFPIFYGIQLVEASDGSGMRPHLVLQDLAWGRLNPSIMDIKIGSRTWPPQASEDYIAKCFKKDRETTSVQLAKEHVQTLTTKDVKLVLKKFVSSNAIADSDSDPDCDFASIVYGGSDGILAQLLELKEWFEDQTFFHFYSCSVLIMFEKELALSGDKPSAVVKLVDFAHVEEGKGVIDHNFLGGLCSLVKFISEKLTAPDEHPLTACLQESEKNQLSTYKDSAASTSPSSTCRDCDTSFCICRIDG